MNEEKYVRFAEAVVFRGLEKPHLFHLQRDELYELDEEGLDFVSEVEGRKKAREIQNQKLLAYAEAEGLLAYSDDPRPRPLPRGSSPLPSLRYLELILTLRCNLRCQHCYLGEPKPLDLSPEFLSPLLSEFDEMQGLRLLLSGGEPLLYPHLAQLAELLPGRGFRVALLTNGHLLDQQTLASLPVHEVQVSLDGLADGHDFLRGPGSFEKALAAARLVKTMGRDLSIATMVHARNFAELPGLAELVQELAPREWSLEAPTPAGRWQPRQDLSWEDLASALSFGFGGSYHGSSEGATCGQHLATVFPDGKVLPCGFYTETPLGHLSQGLKNAWSQKKVARRTELPFCRDCPVGEECGGGCRFRAGGDGPDLVMCAKLGWPKGRPREK